jgi:hypothetical protein
VSIPRIGEVYEVMYFPLLFERLKEQYVWMIGVLSEMPFVPLCYIVSHLEEIVSRHRDLQGLLDHRFIASALTPSPSKFIKDLHVSCQDRLVTCAEFPEGHI